MNQLDEFYSTLLLRYTCPFEKCSKNEGKVKTMGFKEYAIHCGHEHSMVEVAMAADEKRDMSVVVEALQEAREKEGKGGELLMPPVKVGPRVFPPENIVSYNL